MRTLAIGDIHGCSIALARLLEIMHLRETDRIVTIGDYIDRGPDSKGVIDQLIKLSQKHKLVAIRGNHEEIMLHARRNKKIYIMWYGDEGGKDTLDSYALGGGNGMLKDVPEEHWDFLGNYCRDYLETKSHLYIHAIVQPHLAMDQQPGSTLRWARFHQAQPHFSGKVMICGHSPQRSGRPRNMGYAINIDTWAHGGGYLTGLDVHSGEVWQANQLGEARTANIKHFHIEHFKESPWQTV